MLQIAHRQLGEWRLWREIADENELVDPLDLSGRNHDSPSELVIPFEVVSGGSGTENENLTSELGPSIVIKGATPELEGAATLYISDTDWLEFELTFEAPDGSTAGAAVGVTESDFKDVDGEPVDRGFTLFSDNDRYTVDITLDLDLWLILWLRRCLPLYLDASASRAELLVPDPELDEGR
ncbi:MAG: hypothetical protein U5L04_02655 [Trueperaceae bacterium]|nr:hypothetical protein [Trueperaceae bacterium]